MWMFFFHIWMWKLAEVGNAETLIGLKGFIDSILILLVSFFFLPCNN